MEKYTGSVKVMRSYDFCHFEICLGSSQEKDAAEVDEMRKEAARLVDKAVDQYQQMKTYLEEFAQTENFKISALRETVEWIKKINEAEWTPGQKAYVKFLADYEYRRDQHYDYQDDWEDLEVWEDYGQHLD